MREILFRGKTFSNKWVYGSLVDNLIIYNADGEKNKFLHKEVQIKTIGQYIGLTDKNGKKIFQGDIVKVVYTEKRDYQGVKYDDEFEMIETVVYNEKHACFMLEINNEGITMFRPLHDFGSNVRIKNIEIIGNIYDNSELLGE